MGDRTGTGFDGLQAFATDVDSAIEKADRLAIGSRPISVLPGSSSPATPKGPVDRDAGAVASGLKKIGGWALAIGLIILIKSCAYAGFHSFTNSGSSDGYSSQESSDAISDYGEESSSEASAQAEYGTEDLSDTETNPSLDESQPARSDEASGYNDEISMSRPAPGYATLTASELLYCMAEDIRVTAQEAEMQRLQFVEQEKFNRNVPTFNEVVSDYNGVCANRSIVTSDKYLVTAKVERQQSELEEEGRGRVQ